MTTWFLSLRAPFEKVRRLVRARALVEAGASVEWYDAPLSSAAASTRAARLYRRALRLVEATTDGEATPAVEATKGDVGDLRQRARQHTRWRQFWSSPPRPRVFRRMAAVAVVVLVTLVLIRRPLVEALATDLAADAAWRASSIEYLPAAQGRRPHAAAGVPYFVHTKEEKEPFVVLDLGAPQRIGRVRISNRTDCCSERAVPMTIDTSVDGQAWRQVGRRRMAFDTWDHRFSSVSARFVRLRVERRSVLHLSAVSVFP